ncbi:hypothetical protein SPRG_01642 [Saprolegnia parasitica CBS 223.65]|uniref:VWFA domain-containing protein n=1 Tax=Saprolegnia parasitica (strain CBS 223.65) TaxID=695850 RepID=A0A067D4Z2_SAPPC|nr:hypothetical protein SPRG_01642 [Saprolegnia parasitica CBS 223.65]KDO33761.1 hypothetical protein SPRG_01642 [Saprolegnia parasitica CBS 223.65]|eukprot:XP_012195399.1 hypothetical protein SPRG_01642 [Saprolegnia parasitica CBS 223.65]
MDDDAKDAPRLVASPPVREVHLQSADFSQFDGAALSAWHLAQLLQAPPTAVATHGLDAHAATYVQMTLPDEGVALASIAFDDASSDAVLHDETTMDPICLNVTPQSAVYLSFQKYRVVICLDASPSSLSIDPVSGSLFLDVSFTSVERLLHALVQRPCGDTKYATPELHISILVQGALVDSLCVLAQGYMVDDANVHTLVSLLRQRLQLLEDKWATAGPSAAAAAPSSLAMTLQNATFALNSLPHDAAPLLVLVTDGVVDLPHVYAYDHMMMQLARHHITCHAIQLGGGFVPHCSFGYVPDTDLLRYVTAATGGAFFDMQTLSSLPASASPFANHVQAACFLQPSKVCPANPSPEMPLVADRVPMDLVMSYRPLRLFREKVHEFKFVGAIAKLAAARLEEGFCVAKVAPIKDGTRLHCILQWTSDVWLEYTICGPLRADGELAIRIDVLAHAKFLEEFQAVRSMNLPPTNSLCVLLHRFLKDMYERDRTFLHLMSAMTMPTLDQDTTKLHSFSRMATAVAAPHPVFSLVGNLSPLLWHRWFHVERFEMLQLEAATYSKDPLLLETLSKWASMTLSADIYLKFLDTSSSSAKGNVNRKQRGSLTLSLPSASSAPARKALCFVRLERTGHALIVVYVAFYGTSTSARKAVLADLQRTLYAGVNPIETPPSMVLCHRHVQRLFLLPHIIHDLIDPPALHEERSVNAPLVASCCSGSGLVGSVFAAYMWRTLWCWHVESAQQDETIDQLQEERLSRDGFCVVQADDSFVLLAKEVLLHGKKSAVVQYAITVVSESVLCTSLWMEPTSGQIRDISGTFGAAPLEATETETETDGVESAAYYQEMQAATYLADVHILSCMTTFYRILEATKDESTVVGPLDRLGPEAATAGPFYVQESPFSTARLLTTATKTSDRFLLYMEPDAANLELHAMLLESIKRLSDVEVAWTDEMGTESRMHGVFPRLTGGPLWSAARDVAPSCSSLAPGRCFAKLLSETTFVLAFVPALESLPTPTPSVDAHRSQDVVLSERLKWLAGMSSSVVLNAHHPNPMTSADVARFEARRALFEPKADACSSYLALPLTFFECSLDDNASMAASSGLDVYVKHLKAAHETNFAHGVYRALREQRVTLQPCDLLQALWSCQQVAIDLDVSLLHHMLHLLPSAPMGIDPAFDALLSQVLTSIPMTQWYYFAATYDDIVPFFVRLECWQDDSLLENDTDRRPRSNSVRVLSETHQFTDVLKSMLCAANCVPRPESDEDSSSSASDGESKATLEADVLAIVDALRGPMHPKTYLRLVIMTLPPDPLLKKDMDETALPPTQHQVFQDLRLRLQELCAVQVLGMLRCLPSLTPALGSLVQLLFRELPTTSLRRVQYPLEFLPVDGPVSAMALFRTQLLQSRVLPLQACNDLYFVISDRPYWAFFAVDEANAAVWLHLHVTPGAGVDEVSLLTQLHLGVLAVAKQVNQIILLQQLHESRTCSSLLLKSTTPATSTPSHSSSFDAAVASSSFFWPGQFECACQFRRSFKLQDRLIPSVTLNNVCTAALEHGPCFYMLLTLHEAIRQVELTVYGICAPSDEVTIELCRVLERKIDDATQLILMKLLARNAKFPLVATDVQFLCPDVAAPTHVASYALPIAVQDPILLVHIIKDKMIEPSYARAMPPTPSIDVNVLHPAYVFSAKKRDAPSSPVCWTAEEGSLESTPTHSFVLNMNPEFGARSGFVTSCGKGLALVHMDLVDGTSSIVHHAPTGCFAPPGTVWSQVLSASPSPSPSLPSPAATTQFYVRFRVYVRGHLNCAILSEIFALSVKQALYEYAMEAMLAEPSTSSEYPAAMLAEVQSLLKDAAQLTTTTAVLLTQTQVLPTYEIPHIVKQVTSLLQCLPSSHWPATYYQSAPSAPFALFDADTSVVASTYTFRDTFSMVCPRPPPTVFSPPDDPPPLQKTTSMHSLVSVDTVTSSLPSPMASPRHPPMPMPKEYALHDAMLHSTLGTAGRRHLFYTVQISHHGLSLLSYNVHPSALESMCLGISKALSWCALRQSLLSSILFQKRGFALAAPTQCSMLQPTALLERRAPVIGKNPVHMARDVVHSSVAFTPQIFGVVLEHTTAPRSLAASAFRAIEGMGLAEYLRETGTYIEDLSVRPRAISGAAEKLEQSAVSTPMSTSSTTSSMSSMPTLLSSSSSSSGRSLTAPTPVPAPIVRKPPNATNALMAARARARGPLKGPPGATPPSGSGVDDGSENKPPPAWSLTLNKDAIPPRVSKNKVSPVVPSAAALATRRPSGPLPQHPDVTKPSPTTTSTTSSTQATNDTSLAWRSALKTLLPSSFSHYHRDDRDVEGSTKAKDPLIFHGVNLRSALDFHASHRSSYTMVYDLFKSLMTSTSLAPAPNTLRKLVECSRLIGHRQLAVSFSGALPRRTTGPSHDILSLLAYEIQFIFNNLFGSIARLHVDDLLCTEGMPASAAYSQFVSFCTRAQASLGRRHAADVSQLLVAHLRAQGLRPLQDLTHNGSGVYAKKADGVAGLILIELSQTTKSHHLGVRAYFVSERDVVSLDAGRHLPQSSYPVLSRADLVSTFQAIKDATNVRRLVYDYVISDLHAFVLHTLSVSTTALQAHVAFDDPATSAVRNCVGTMNAFLDAYPSAPDGAQFGLQAWEFVVENVATLLRYIACHATRYYVSDLLIFGTPDAIATKSATGRFIKDFNEPIEQNDDTPYTLVLTSSSQNTLKVYALHTTDALSHLWEHVELFVMELMRVASVDYRRDILWSRLLFGAAQTGLDAPPCHVDVQQLEDCLALSVRTPFDRIDPVLTELLAVTQVEWSEFLGLLKVVHKDGMREYQFHNRRHVLLMCESARDIMIHIYHDDVSGLLSMEICRREEPANGALSHEQRQTVRDLVNHIVYWLWTQVAT